MVWPDLEAVAFEERIKREDLLQHVWNVVRDASIHYLGEIQDDQLVEKVQHEVQQAIHEMEVRAGVPEQKRIAEKIKAEVTGNTINFNFPEMIDRLVLNVDLGKDDG
jgi:hypothetical protein